MNDQWHHICILWEGAADSGYTSYYRDGAEVKFQPCSVGTRNAGGALQIGGGGRTENVGITGFNLWNRILTESEIVEEANICDGGMGGPTVKWREFYKKSLRRNFIRELSQCVVSGGKYLSAFKHINLALTKSSQHLRNNGYSHSTRLHGRYQFTGRTLYTQSSSHMRVSISTGHKDPS